MREGGKLADPRERDRLLFWYIHTMLWGRYSAGTEGVLNQDLAAIEEIDGGLDRLIEGLRRNRGDLEIITANDFSGFERRGARFYPLLYMLTRVNHSKDWCDTGIELSAHMLGKLSGTYRLHHIFPKSLLYKHAVFSRQRGQRFGELHFSDTRNQLRRYPIVDPAKYIPEFVERQPGAIESHWIPMDPDLWQIENYPDFLRT